MIVAYVFASWCLGGHSSIPSFCFCPRYCKEACQISEVTGCQTHNEMNIKTQAMGPWESIYQECIWFGYTMLLNCSTQIHIQLSDILRGTSLSVTVTKIITCLDFRMVLGGDPCESVTCSLLLRGINPKYCIVLCGCTFRIRYSC